MSEYEIHGKKTETVVEVLSVRPCVKCGGDEGIEVRDCGYASFNPMIATCKSCGFQVRGGWTYGFARMTEADHRTMVSKWNETWDRDPDRLIAELHKLQARIDAVFERADELATEGESGDELLSLFYAEFRPIEGAPQAGSISCAKCGRDITDKLRDEDG